MNGRLLGFSGGSEPDDQAGSNISGCRLAKGYAGRIGRDEASLRIDSFRVGDDNLGAPKCVAGEILDAMAPSGRIAGFLVKRGDEEVIE